MSRLATLTCLVTLAATPVLAQSGGDGDGDDTQRPPHTLSPNDDGPNFPPPGGIIQLRRPGGGPDIMVSAAAVPPGGCQDYFILYQLDANGEIDPQSIQVDCGD